jgi:hypothetical protein
MSFVRDFYLRGGLLTVGSDAGFLYTPDGTTTRVGGVTHTIKGGIVFDAARLRADVRDMVAEERERLGVPAPSTA